MSTHPPVHYCPDCDCWPCQCKHPWAHDPDVCPSSENCPGCWAEAYTPPKLWDETFPRAERASDEAGRDGMFEAYDNGDRAEDVEAGNANDSGAAFWTQDGS